MTEFTITPDLERKTAKFKGTVAAGEAVRVYVAAPEIANTMWKYHYPTMRLRVRVAGRTVAAVDPAADGEAQWELDALGDVERARATLNLDTAQMRAAFRHVPEMDALFVLDDPDRHVLYCAAPCAVRGWPMEEGADEPVDLRGYADFVKDVSARLAEVEGNYLRTVSPRGEGTGKVGWSNSNVLAVDGHMLSDSFTVATEESPSAKVYNRNGRTVADDIAEAASALQASADSLKERVDAIMSRTEDPIALESGVPDSEVYSLWYVWRYVLDTANDLSRLQYAHDNLQDAHDKTASAAAQSSVDCAELLGAMEDVKAWQNAQTKGFGTDSMSIYKNHIRLNGVETRLDTEMATKEEIEALSAPLKGVTVKTNTTNGIRDAVKAIARALGAAKVSSIALCALCAGAAEVQTAPLGELDLDTDPRVVTNVTFGGLATEGYVDASLSSKADAAALSAYATSNDLSSVASSVSAVWERVFGESVWIAVTNYMRTTDAKPSMGLWERRDGQTNLVWSSAEEIDSRVDALRADVTNGIQSAQTSADAARAWGRWQSADGAGAPDGFTMVTTPYLMLTGGGAWEQRTVEGASYWLFCGNGSVGGTDETFRMLDSQGASVFEVTRGSVREVPAVPSSFSVELRADPDGMHHYYDVSFGVQATSEPTLYWSTEGPAGPWQKRSAAWTGVGGTNYVVSISLEAWLYPSAFFKAVYETGAEPVVDFKRPLKFPELSIGGTNYAVSVGVMSDGTKFLKLEDE